MLGIDLVFTLFWSASALAEVVDIAAEQLEIFKQQHPFPFGTLSKTSGESVEFRELSTLNQSLLTNDFLMETLTHFNREKIPERVVHASGAGAFGYFEVTHDISHLCKAKLFSEIGKRTQVAARFSMSSGEKGTSELSRDFRGFAVKFYTEEGIYDFVGFNIPVFAIKDPVHFSSLSHALKRNPQTNLYDKNMLWDFITIRPESVHMFLWVFSDFGIPYGYGYMRGFSVHTLQVYNDVGESHFLRIHIYPEWGTKTLSAYEAAEISGENPYQFTKQLYNDIANKKYPTWKVYIQVLTIEDVKNAEFDVFDITRILPIEKYPLTPLGKIILNVNPKNYMAEIEQLAFSSNFVPGILGPPDKMFDARRFTDRGSQNYRLSVNSGNIPVNSPFDVKPNNYSDHVLTYLRDGRPPVSNLGGAPNYSPNSFNGPEPCVEKNRPNLIKVQQNDAYSFYQARDFYISKDEGEKTRLVNNIVDSLNSTATFIQKKAIKMFYDVYHELGERIEYSLNAEK